MDCVHPHYHFWKTTSGFELLGVQPNKVALCPELPPPCALKSDGSSCHDSCVASWHFTWEMTKVGGHLQRRPSCCLRSIPGSGWSIDGPDFRLCAIIHVFMPSVPTTDRTNSFRAGGFRGAPKPPERAISEGAASSSVNTISAHGRLIRRSAKTTVPLGNSLFHGWQEARIQHLLVLSGE